MKNTKLMFLICIIILGSKISFAQNVNWKSLNPNQKHLINVNIGWDYGLVYGIGYSYQLKTKMPTLLDISYSVPSGNKILDDFKTTFGARMQIYEINNFQFNASVHGIYRRNQNSLVRLQNFGSEVTGIVGYYKPKWFVAGEFGFDKAIVTHFKHSEDYKLDFPGVKDGWYEPSTGGNINFGLQTGYSLKSSELTLKFGQVLTQDFKSKPLIPLYFQFGYNFKINSDQK